MGCCVLWISILLINHLSSVCETQWCSGVLSGDDCVIFGGADRKLSWDAANRYCHQQYGGSLVNVFNSSRQTAVQSLMKSDSVSGSWIGGKEQLNQHWVWTVDYEIIARQGCYSENLSNREFNRSIAFDEGTLQPPFCTSSCHLLGYDYAALFDSGSCYCSTSFGRYGTSGGCDQICEGDNTELCGGAAQNTVWYIGGAYGKWANLQPDNDGNNQYCGAMDTHNSANLTIDEECDISYPYVCQIESCVSNLTTAEGYWVTSILSHCYFISKIGRSWSAASEDCMLKTGHLVKLDTAFRVQDVATLISQKTSTQSRYWIGLSKYKIGWASGISSSYTGYTNFRSGLPTINTDGCIGMAATDNYTWTDDECSSTKNFYCQYNRTSVAPPTTTSTSTTTITTTRATTLPDTTTTPQTTTTTTRQPTTTTHPPTTTTTHPPTTTTQPTPTTIQPTTTTTRQPTTTTHPTTTTTQPTTTTRQPTTTSPPTTTTRSSTMRTTTLVQTATSTSPLPPATTTTTGLLITPEVGAATGSTNNTLLIALVILFCLVLLVVFVCIFLVCCLRHQHDKRKIIAPDPEDIIPYGVKPDPYIHSTPIMSIDAYLANAAVRNHGNNSKASLVSGDTSLNNIQVKKNTHGTQTTDQYAQYTKTLSMRNADLETQSQSSIDNEASSRKRIFTGRKSRRIKDNSGTSDSNFSGHDRSSDNAFDDMRASQKLYQPPLYIPPASDGEEKLWSRNKKTRQKKSKGRNTSGENYNSDIHSRVHSIQQSANLMSHDSDTSLNETTKSSLRFKGLPRSGRHSNQVHSETEDLSDSRVYSNKSEQLLSQSHQKRPTSPNRTRSRTLYAKGELGKSNEGTISSENTSPIRTKSSKNHRMSFENQNSRLNTRSLSGRRTGDLVNPQRKSKEHLLESDSDDNTVYHTSNKANDMNGLVVDQTPDDETQTIKQRNTSLCPECGKKVTLLRKHLISKHDYKPRSDKLRTALAEFKNKA